MCSVADTGSFDLKPATRCSGIPLFFFLRRVTSFIIFNNMSLLGVAQQKTPPKQQQLNTCPLKKLVEFVQDGIYALRKAHIRSTPALRTSPSQSLFEPVWPDDKASVRLVSRRRQFDCGFGSPPSSAVVVYGCCLVTLLLGVNETLKLLSSLPILVQNYLGAKEQC